MDEKRLKIQEKAFALLVCTLVFTLVYNCSAWYISKLTGVPSFVFDFEKHIPFLTWSIIPYMSSGVFFCLVFFFCKTKEELTILTKRMLFVTIVAGISFMIFPLRFSLLKPEVSNQVLDFQFELLRRFDTSFNQAPSLHIAFAFVFWAVLRNHKRWKNISMIILILLGISTLTTYQHHVIDVVTGSILAHICFIVFPYRKNDSQYRNYHVANYYFLSGWIFILAALLLFHFSGYPGLAFLWMGFMTILIGYHYQKNNIHFLKDINGNISVLKKIFYFPYVLIYKILWQFLRKNQKPVEILPNLFISSRPSQKEPAYFPLNKNIFVYDLSAEIEATEKVKKNTTYQSVPFLDIGNFDIEKTKKLVTEITNTYNSLPENGKILIYCTMGFTRSSVIGILLMKNTLSLSLQEAANKMKILNKNAVIHPYVWDFLKKNNL